jgi:hypothetical protein
MSNGGVNCGQSARLGHAPSGTSGGGQSAGEHAPAFVYRDGLNWSTLNPPAASSPLRRRGSSFQRVWILAANLPHSGARRKFAKQCTLGMAPVVGWLAIGGGAWTPGEESNRRVSHVCDSEYNVLTLSFTKNTLKTSGSLLLNAGFIEYSSC